jgi:4-alpha-glucanotransferase
MLLSFKIDYQTYGGGKLFVGGSSPELGQWNPDKALPMKDNEAGEWEAEIQGDFSSDIEYKYLIKNNGSFIWEWGKPRIINSNGNNFDEIRARDFWRPQRDRRQVHR